MFNHTFGIIVEHSHINIRRVNSVTTSLDNHFLLLTNSHVCMRPKTIYILFANHSEFVRKIKSVTFRRLLRKWFMLTYYESILEFRIFDHMDHVISLFCEILSLTLLRYRQRGRSRYMNCENYVLFLAIIMTLHAILQSNNDWGFNEHITYYFSKT